MQDRKRWARAQAERLKRFLKAQGITLPHKQCLEAVASMHGSSNWQTFEASEDSDLVVNDPNALSAVVETALQCVLLEEVPEGVTLSSLCSTLRTAEGSGEAALAAKVEFASLRERLVPRKWDLPVGFAEKVDSVRLILHRALQALLLKKAPKTNSTVTEIFRSTLRDWRVGGGEDLPATDARVYEVKFSAGTEMAVLDCTYPHDSPESLPIDSPQLAVNLEIDKGLPCVHVYADVHFGEPLVSIYAMRDGKLAVRFSVEESQLDCGAVHPIAEKLGLDLTSRVVNP